MGQRKSWLTTLKKITQVNHNALYTELLPNIFTLQKAHSTFFVSENTQASFPTFKPSKNSIIFFKKKKLQQNKHLYYMLFIVVQPRWQQDIGSSNAAFFIKERQYLSSYFQLSFSNFVAPENDMSNGTRLAHYCTI